ncbi:hypothetical protein MMRN_09460 [Mycobacterium marinum]|nr:hypothetical protein MMRN_09460 [Mycobacterium marinum]
MVARAAAKPNQPAYGAAALAMACDAAPCHAPSARLEVTDPNEATAEPSSPANASQAAAAASSGPDPAPEYIRAELISGANTEKIIAERPS